MMFQFLLAESRYTSNMRLDAIKHQSTRFGLYRRTTKLVGRGGPQELYSAQLLERDGDFEVFFVEGGGDFGALDGHKVGLDGVIAAEAGAFETLFVHGDAA